MAMFWKTETLKIFFVNVKESALHIYRLSLRYQVIAMSLT